MLGLFQTQSVSSPQKCLNCTIGIFPYFSGMTPSPPLVLYAEDDRLNQKLFEFALKEFVHSFEVVYLNDGEELLSYLAKTLPLSKLPLLKRPTAILLDINMPRINGFEALAAIKAESDLAAIAVAIFSSASDEKTIKKCYEMGAVAYLEKPMGLDGYSEVIASLELICQTHTRK